MVDYGHLMDNDLAVIDIRLKAQSAAIQSLGEIPAVMEASETEYLRDHFLREAQFRALSSILAELANESGVSYDKFSAVLDARVQFFHGKILDHCEQDHPELVARADTRDTSSVWTEPDCPPLFD